MISLNVCSPTSLLAMHDAGLRANCSCSWANNSPYLLTARGAAGRGSPNNYSRAEEGFDLPPPSRAGCGPTGRASGRAHFAVKMAARSRAPLKIDSSMRCEVNHLVRHRAALTAARLSTDTSF